MSGEAGERQRVSKAEFDAVYEEAVLHRNFVEDEAYYELSRGRFWHTFQRIEALNLPAGSHVLDIGGGIVGVLLNRLLGLVVQVGDVNDRAAGDLRALGIDFTEIDLMSDTNEVDAPFDLVVLTEVIGHIPVPPYIVFRRIGRFLRPGGILFLTTPNGYRFRNVLYMLAGKEMLDSYRYPEPGEAMGQQHDYTLQHLRWQLEAGGFTVLSEEQCDSGWKGATLSARLARLAIRPVSIVPHLRENLVISARFNG